MTRMNYKGVGDTSGMILEGYEGEYEDIMDPKIHEGRSPDSMYYLRKAQGVEDKIHNLEQLIEGLTIDLSGSGVDESTAESINSKIQGLRAQLYVARDNLVNRKMEYEAASGKGYTGYGGGKKRKSRRNKRRGSKRKSRKSRRTRRR